MGIESLDTSVSRLFAWTDDSWTVEDLYCLGLVARELVEVKVGSEGALY